MAITTELSRVQLSVMRWINEDLGVGLSSQCMAMFLAFGRPGGRYHPHDPSDFDRCLRLLDRIPALRLKLGNMANVSKPWARLIEHWDELEQSHLAEVGLDWTKARVAPQTYKLMRSVLDGKHTKPSGAKS